MTSHPERSCKEYARLLEPFFDGALAPADVLEMEEHVGGCEGCRERVEILRASRGTLKKLVKTTAPAGLRDRIAASMVAEEQRGRESAAPQPLRNPGWRAAIPLATAAAFALMWGMGNKLPVLQTGTAVNKASIDNPLDDFLFQHAQPLPPEQTDPKGLRSIEPYVGVRVRPPRIEKAALVGWRVLPVHHERAAMLQYRVGNAEDSPRVSVFIYDPQRIQVGSAGLSPRTMGTADVRVGTEKSYSVAVVQRDGVGVVVTADDPERSVQFAKYISEDTSDRIP